MGSSEESGHRSAAGGQTHARKAAPAERQLQGTADVRAHQGERAGAGSLDQTRQVDRRRDRGEAPQRGGSRSRQVGPARLRGGRNPARVTGDAGVASPGRASSAAADRRGMEVPTMATLDEAKRDKLKDSTFG